MNIATILGFVAGIAILAVATFFSTSNSLVFINPAGFAIVFGGTAAAICICYPIREVTRTFNAFLLALSREELPIGMYIDELVKLAKQASQRGQVALEKELPGLDNHFMRFSVQKLVDGYSRQEIEAILNTRIEQQFEQDMSSAGIFRTMAKLSPAFGIIGTLIGLIGMMQSLGGDIHALGPAMATALTTTLYGVLFANMLFLPIAIKVEKRIEERCLLMTVIRDGILYIHDRAPAGIVLDKLRAYLPPRRWATITTAPQER